MKKRIAVIGIIAAVCILAGSSWYFFGRNHSGNTDNAVYVTEISSLMGIDEGTQNRYAGVVEPQQTVNIKLESNRQVKEVKVTVGQQVKAGDPLFEYDVSSSQDSLTEAKLELERLKNEALSYQDQITNYQKEKEQAEQDQQLSYTIQIETAKMNLKKNEYNQKSKEAEIAKLEQAAVNTVVTSEIDGVIQSIDTSKLDAMAGSDDSAGNSTTTLGSSNENAFMTILSTGAYRVKANVNEQNISDIVEGTSVIIRSRVDDEQTWKGTMGKVDMDSAVQSSDSASAMIIGGSSENSQTTSTTYPFYVELTVSDGLMLGQHVYIEPDNGQGEKKEGVWLYESYIADVDTDHPYVWIADKNEKLKKQSVTLGEYDQELGEYEIKEGLSEDDFIAFPEEGLEEGMPTVINNNAYQNAGQDGEEGSYEMTDPQNAGSSSQSETAGQNGESTEISSGEEGEGIPQSDEGNISAPAQEIPLDDPGTAVTDSTMPDSNEEMIPVPDAVMENSQNHVITDEPSGSSEMIITEEMPSDMPVEDMDPIPQGTEVSP